VYIFYGNIPFTEILTCTIKEKLEKKNQKKYFMPDTLEKAKRDRFTHPSIRA